MTKIIGVNKDMICRISILRFSSDIFDLVIIEPVFYIPFFMRTLICFQIKNYKKLIWVS